MERNTVTVDCAPNSPPTSDALEHLGDSFFFLDRALPAHSRERIFLPPPKTESPAHARALYKRPQIRGPPAPRRASMDSASEHQGICEAGRMSYLPSQGQRLADLLKGLIRIAQIP